MRHIKSLVISPFCTKASFFSAAAKCVSFGGIHRDRRSSPRFLSTGKEAPNLLTPISAYEERVKAGRILPDEYQRCMFLKYFVEEVCH